MFKSYHQQIITIGISIHSSSSRHKSYIIHIKNVVDLGQIMNFKKWWLADEFFSLISNFWILLLLLLPPSTTPWFIIWLIRFFLFSFDFGPRKKSGISKQTYGHSLWMIWSYDHDDDNDDDDGHWPFWWWWWQFLFFSPLSIDKINFCRKKVCTFKSPFTLFFFSYYRYIEQQEDK